MGGMLVPHRNINKTCVLKRNFNQIQTKGLTNVRRLAGKLMRIQELPGNSEISMSLIFPPTFENASSSTATSELIHNESSDDVDHAVSRPDVGGFAAFVCHVAYLETSLQRGESSRFFSKDNRGLQFASRTHIGSGLSFSVDRAELKHDQRHKRADSAVHASSQFVAIKTVRAA